MNFHLSLQLTSFSLRRWEIYWSFYFKAAIMIWFSATNCFMDLCCSSIMVFCSNLSILSFCTISFRSSMVFSALFIFSKYNCLVILQILFPLGQILLPVHFLLLLSLLVLVSLVEHQRFPGFWALREKMTREI